MVFATVMQQVAVLLQRASVLRQSPSARDDHDLRPHAVEVCLPDDAETTIGQVPCREGQNAAGKTDSCPHTLSTVDVRLSIVLVSELSDLAVYSF